MSKQLEFKAKDVKAFTSWLKRFSSIDGSLLLEIDNNLKEFLAKSYNEEKSVVKFSKINFENSGFNLITKDTPRERIKIGLYSIPQLIKTLDHFEGEFSVIFKYEEVTDDGGSNIAGTNILIKSDNLKVGFECSSLKIFKYIADDVFENVICNMEEIVGFELKKEDIAQIVSLSTLDKDLKNMEFLNKKTGHLYAKSKSFEYLLSISSKVDARLPFLKSQFEKIDIENYKVSIGEDRMVLTSIDEATKTVISMLEENEYDSKEDNL